MRARNGRDADVVIDDLTFGEAGFWVEDFVEVGKWDSFTFDVREDSRLEGREPTPERWSGRRLVVRFSCQEYVEPTR